MTAQNMSLWHKDYFEVEVFEKKQIIRKALCLSSICLKAGLKFVKVSPNTPLPGRTEVNHQR